MAREVTYGLSIRTDRKSSIRSVKNFLRSLNCISLVGLRISIFTARVVIYGLSIKYWPYGSQKWYMVRKELFTVRKLHLISGTFFMGRERRHGLSIQTDNTNCKTRILKRSSRFIADCFWQSSSARAPRSLVQQLGGGGLKLVRLSCQGKD